MPVADDYSGPFDPTWSPAALSRAGLARLCREYQMVSMFHDRALMPHVATIGGTEATVTLADGEWMGSSPIYTRRNLANAGVVGDTVSSIAKGIQLDIGGPDHFLDSEAAQHVGDGAPVRVHRPRAKNACR